MTSTAHPATEPSPATNDPSDWPAERLARIEEVALRTGLTKRTLRYYEEIGLLAPPTRNDGGYRLYTAADVQRLERIKRLKDLLGFSLAEIRELVQAEEDREQMRAAWHRASDPRDRLALVNEAETLVRRQLRVVEDKLAGLQDMRDSLLARLARYDDLRAEMRAQRPAAE
jgi:DNA-binding transcriptional MerR regulator